MSSQPTRQAAPQLRWPGLKSRNRGMRQPETAKVSRRTAEQAPPDAAPAPDPTGPCPSSGMRWRSRAPIAGQWQARLAVAAGLASLPTGRARPAAWALLVADRDARVLSAEVELSRQLVLDPSRTYQPLG